MTRYAREVKTYEPEEVRAKLDELGVTPYALAHKVGIHPTTMYDHLSHKRVGSHVLRIRIAEVLDRLENEEKAPRVPEGAVGPRVRRL